MDWRLGNMEVSYQTRQCQKTSCCNFHWYSHYSQTKYVSDGLKMCKKRPTLTVIKAFSEFFRIEACNIAMKYRIFICYTTNGQHYSWQYLMYINVSLVCLAGSLQVGSNRKLRTQGWYYQKSFPPSLTELKNDPFAYQTQTEADPYHKEPILPLKHHSHRKINPSLTSFTQHLFRIIVPLLPFYLITNNQPNRPTHIATQYTWYLVMSNPDYSIGITQ